MEHQSRLIQLLLGSVLLMTLVNCSSKQLYYWGDYEPTVYNHYINNSSPSQEIERLRSDEKEARSAKLPHPPGYHSYLGYLYYQVGNYSMAQAEFAKEKLQFPESGKLMSRFSKKSK